MAINPNFRTDLTDLVAGWGDSKRATFITSLMNFYTDDTELADIIDQYTSSEGVDELVALRGTTRDPYEVSADSRLTLAGELELFVGKWAGYEWANDVDRLLRNRECNPHLLATVTDYAAAHPGFNFAAELTTIVRKHS